MNFSWHFLKRPLMFLQISGFGGLGVFSFLWILISTLLLHEYAYVPVNIAYAFALFTAIIINFYVCRYIIFKASGSAIFQFYGFIVSSIIFRSSEWIFFSIQQILLDIHYGYAMLAIHSFTFFAKFIFYRLYLFGPASDKHT